MDQSLLPENRLKWSTKGRTPIWPGEPDIVAVAQLSAEALQCAPEDLEVRYFAEGAVNKLFEVILRGPQKAIITAPKSYLMRVTLPIDPFYKTESDVATLHYIATMTKVPVADVIAWDSSSNNALGHEWCLIEKLKGVELTSVWPRMSLEQRIALVKTLAKYTAELWRQEFQSIGSIYIKGYENRQQAISEPNRRKEDKIFHMTEMSQKFFIGPAVSSIYFRRRRLYLDSDRGPYTNTRHWLKAKAQLQSNYASTEQALLWSVTKQEDRKELDEEYLTHGRRIVDLCTTYQAACNHVSTSGRTTSGGPFVLCHEDLHQGNMLVDPETFEITAVLDWEMIQVLPEWRACAMPKLLEGDEHSGMPMFGWASGERGDNKEQKLLRKVFREAVEAEGMWMGGRKEDEAVSALDQGIMALSDKWRLAAELLEEALQKAGA